MALDQPHLRVLLHRKLRYPNDPEGHAKKAQQQKYWEDVKVQQRHAAANVGLKQVVNAACVFGGHVMLLIRNLHLRTCRFHRLGTACWQSMRHRCHRTFAFCMP